MPFFKNFEPHPPPLPLGGGWGGSAVLPKSLMLLKTCRPTTISYPHANGSTSKTLKANEKQSELEMIIAVIENSIYCKISFVYICVMSPCEQYSTLKWNNVSGRRWQENNILITINDENIGYIFAIGCTQETHFMIMASSFHFLLAYY